MTPSTRYVRVNGHDCRVWDAGSGDPLVYLSGLVGCPVWTPFLERISARHRVIVPSLPGFPGGTGHEDLDTLVDWLAACLDLLDAAWPGPAHLVASSFGGLLGAEIAALVPERVRTLTLVAPLGLWLDDDPPPDLWARTGPDRLAMLTSDPDALSDILALPDGEDHIEWEIQNARTFAAAARLLWPTGDLGLNRRLHRITAPTLVVWGDADAVVPHTYAQAVASGVGGAVDTVTIVGAGHLVDVDAPDMLADSVANFLGSSTPATTARA